VRRNRSFIAAPQLSTQFLNRYNSRFPPLPNYPRYQQKNPVENKKQHNERRPGVIDLLRGVKKYLLIIRSANQMLHCPVVAPVQAGGCHVQRRIAEAPGRWFIYLMLYKKERLSAILSNFFKSPYCAEMLPNKIQASTIVLPNGSSETSISLKCCRAKGRPMMVIASSRPKTRCARAIHRPPKKSQIMFSTKARHPLPELPFTAMRPKGHSTKWASLKHCSPKGMPTMVRHNTRPPTI